MYTTTEQLLLVPRRCLGGARESVVPRYPDLRVSSIGAGTQVGIIRVAILDASRTEASAH